MNVPEDNSMTIRNLMSRDGVDKRKIAGRIRYLRNDMGYNQKEFSEKLGMAQTMVSGIETGRREIFDRHIKAICWTFNVNERWLILGEGDMYKRKPDEFDETVSPTKKAVITAFLSMTDEEMKLFVNCVAKISTNLINVQDMAATLRVAM